MDGLIPYKDAFTNERFVYKDTGKFKAKLLPERYKKIFRAKQIVCVEYQDLTGDNEREIFQRVQLGMALTPAGHSFGTLLMHGSLTFCSEKLQAINSPTATFIRELQNQYVIDGLAQALDWDITRGSDFRGLASAVYSIDKWPGLNTMAGLTQVQKWLQLPEEPDEHFCDQVHQTFQIFVMLATDKRYNGVFKLEKVKKVSPVEFVAITLLISVHKSKFTLVQLSEAIGMMRRDIRETETDIRMNARVMKTMLAFIKNLKASQLKADPGQPAAAKLGTMKRKRTAKMEVEDGEYVEQKQQPVSSSATAGIGSRQSSSSASLPAHSVLVSHDQPQVASRRSISQLPPTPASSTTPVFPPPSVPDRLAAVKAAKAGEASHTPTPRLIPSEPTALRNSPSEPATFRNIPSEPATLRGAYDHRSSNGYPSNTNTSPYNLPAAPVIPPPPTPPSRYDSLGDSLMARMMAPRSAPAPPHGNRAPYPSSQVSHPPPPRQQDMSQMGMPVPRGTALSQAGIRGPGQEYDRRRNIPDGYVRRDEPYSSSGYDDRRDHGPTSDSGRDHRGYASIPDYRGGGNRG
ncbi:hypothetical protein AcW1_002916 [Taiwanofungus camphoratus]|nr:hypothetical protein AcW1_002916 [Antrodia cinnamomea]